MWFGKIYSQSLHHWIHWKEGGKWFYDKDPNAEWIGMYAFYKALHENLPSEKIVSLYYPSGGSGGEPQIWGDLTDLSS